MTYGPVGRVVATIAVFVPILWGWEISGPFFLLAGALWLITIVPLALRDIWRPARTGPPPNPPIVVPPEPGELLPGTPIAEREPPARW